MNVVEPLDMICPDSSPQQLMKALDPLAPNHLHGSPQQLMKALDPLAVAERDIRGSNTRTAPHSRG